jgi:hypothetical protein
MACGVTCRADIDAARDFVREIHEQNHERGIQICAPQLMDSTYRATAPNGGNWSRAVG